MKNTTIYSSSEQVATQSIYNAEFVPIFRTEDVIK